MLGEADARRDSHNATVGDPRGAIFGQNVIIDEGLIGGVADPASNLVMLNATMITEPVPGSGDFVLQLTDAINNQSGAAWFDVPFDLRSKKVVFEVDMFIWAGSLPPADGISAVFQFFAGANSATRTARIGGGGGGLGTNNFPSSYVSVAWDTWDNEGNPDIDPENSIWDAAAFAGGRTHSAHIEINQDLNPGAEFSIATNIDSTGLDVPYMIDDAVHPADRGPNDAIAISNAVGDIWGPSNIVLPVARYTVTFESGFITVSLEEIVEIGGEVFPPIYYDPNPGPNFELPWNNRSLADRTLILTALSEFPADANAILGFIASTGGANEKHEVDNIKVTTFDNPRELVDQPSALTDSGGVNAGGGEVLGTSLGDFVADAAFGTIIDVDTLSDPNAIILTRSCPGFEEGGSTGDNGGAPIQNVDASLEEIFQTKRFSGANVSYTSCVSNGRYEVKVLLSTDLPTDRRRR